MDTANSPNATIKTKLKCLEHVINIKIYLRMFCSVRLYPRL